MIIDFTISNFRSIKEPQTISFEATNDNHLEEYYVVKKGKYRLLKMAAIMGANASGKSNVIRALEMFPELMLVPCESKSSKIKYDRFALDSEYRTKNSEMTVNFICEDSAYCFNVIFNNDYIQYERLTRHPFDALRPHVVYERNTNIETLVSSIKWGEYNNKKYGSVSGLRDINVNLLHNRTFFGAFEKSNLDIPWAKTILDWAGNYIMPLVRTSGQHLSDYTSGQLYEDNIAKQQVIDLLRKADVGINDILLEKTKVEISPKVVRLLMDDESTPSGLKKKLSENPYTEKVKVQMVHNGKDGGVSLNYNDESHGTKRYYELSSILLNLIKESHFVCVDELECRLHPDLYEHFIITYLTNSNESQMVFTTHNREFLDNRDIYRDDSVWLTEKNEKGETEVYSLADFGSDIIRSTTSRYNAYRSGKLGAIPRLGDTHINQMDDN